MPFADRADMSPKVLSLNLQDEQLDVAGPIADGVSGAAVLEGFMFDVVTQQSAAWTLPLDREL